MAFGGHGGCVITTLGRNFVRVSDVAVTQEQLRYIARTLGIPESDLKDVTIRTIFYVTPAPSKKSE